VAKVLWILEEKMAGSRNHKPRFTIIYHLYTITWVIMYNIDAANDSIYALRKAVIKGRLHPQVGNSIAEP
jgi:hypothetical protein